MIATGLTDWMVGSRVYMGPSGHRYAESDYRTITAYESSTGKLTLDSILTYYHYGAAASTEDKYTADNG